MLNKIEIEGEAKRDLYARYGDDGELRVSIPIYIDNNPDSRSYIYVKADGEAAHIISDLDPREGDMVRIVGKLVRETWVRPLDGSPAGAYKIIAGEFKIVRSAAESRKLLADRNQRELDRRDINEPDGNRGPHKPESGNRRPPGPDFSKYA